MRRQGLGFDTGTTRSWQQSTPPPLRAGPCLPSETLLYLLIPLRATLLSSTRMLETFAEI